MKAKRITSYFIIPCVGLLVMLAICAGTAEGAKCDYSTPRCHAATIGYCVYWKTPWLIYWPDDPTKMRIYFEVHTGVNNDSHHRTVDVSGGDVSVSCDKIDINDGYDSYLCHADVTHLTPGKKYDFTVKARRYTAFDHHWTCFGGSFTAAAPEDATTLEFYAFGDNKYIQKSSSSTTDISKVVNEINSHSGKKTFIINTGDLVYKGGVDRGFSDNRWDQFFKLKHVPYFLASMPMLTTMGNHDYQTEHGGYSSGNADIYYRYFPYSHAPGGGVKDAYYWLGYGPALFWSVDAWPADGYCTTCDNLKDTSEQYRWFEQTLQKAEDDHRQWKIVSMHSPPYSPGDCNQADAQKYFVPLFEKYGVDIVLAGHEHYYSRTPIDDTISGSTIPYLVLGGGGAGLSNISHPDPNKFIAKKEHHFAYFQIDHDQLHVQVINDSGDQIDEFYVDRNPVAKFEADPTEGLPPLTVNFTDESTGHRYQYDWDFGDGSEHSQERNPTHTYTEDGIYSVKLTVKSAFNTSTHTASIKVRPVANFDADPTEGELPLSVSFSDESKGDVLAYLWDFGDGTTSTEPNPEHLYDENGKFSVKLTVNGQKTSDTKTRHDYIKVEPYADFSADPDGCFVPSCFDGCDINFIDKSQGDALTYHWDFGNGHTSTEQNPSVGFIADGDETYKIKLVVTDSNGLIDSKTGYIWVECIPWPTHR